MRIADDSFQKLPFLGEVNTHRMQFMTLSDGSCSKQLPIMPYQKGCQSGETKIKQCIRPHHLLEFGMVNYMIVYI